jgi:hypothetical protein
MYFLYLYEKTMKSVEIVLGRTGRGRKENN